MKRIKQTKQIKKDKKAKNSKPKTKTKNKKAIKLFGDILIIVFASLVYSFGLHCFTAPNSIAPGGVVGISVVLNSFLPIPIGTLYALINVPLIILGFIILGKANMLKTVISVIFVSVATDWLFVYFPTYTGDKILASVFGGVLSGIGLGLIYQREGTSGGIDIVNRIIMKKLPHLKMGAIMLFTDIVVIVVAMLVFRNIESGLYAIIVIFVSGRVVDLILYGQLEGKLMLIFSEKYDDISREIIVEEGRGVTLLKGVGVYSGNDKNVICCAVSKNQYARVKRRINEIDKNAFIVITSAGEVFGEGFSKIE